MGVDANLYEFVLVLHILAVVIGFGGTFIAGFYGREASKRPGREGLAIGETALKVTSLIPTMAVYAVPVLGILLILLSDDAWKFSQAWVSLSFLLYIVLVGLATGLQVPTVRKLVAARAAADGAMTPEVDALARRLVAVGGAINLMWVAVMFLMVFKPGH